MKKLFMTIGISLAALFANAQNVVPNGDMENWDSYSAIQLSGWHSFGTVSQINSNLDGTFGARIENNVHNQLPGFIFYGTIQPDGSLSGGTPTKGRPDSLTGYFRYNIAKNDTAAITIILMRKGNYLSADNYTIYGSNTQSFKRLSFKINYFGIGNADSAIIAISSGNMESDTVYDGWLEVDKLSFTGANPKIDNGNFENWVNKSYDMPKNWSAVENYELQPVQKTTDAHSGKYAMKIQNVLNAPAQAPGVCTTTSKNGDIYNLSPAFPLSGAKPTSLNCYYKYTPQNGDSAYIYTVLYKNGIVVGSGQAVIGSISNSYKLLTIPIQYISADKPDSAAIKIAAYNIDDIWGPKGESVLFVDDITFDNTTSGIEANNKIPSNLSLYPNPAHDKLNLVYTGQEKIETIDIYDLTGKPCLHYNYAVAEINTDNLRAGIYIIEAHTQQGTDFQKFVKN